MSTLRAPAPLSASRSRRARTQRATKSGGAATLVVVGSGGGRSLPSGVLPLPAPGRSGSVFSWRGNAVVGNENVWLSFATQPIRGTVRADRMPWSSSSFKKTVYGGTSTFSQYQSLPALDALPSSQL